jgi:hypothetical protein
MDFLVADTVGSFTSLKSDCRLNCTLVMAICIAVVNTRLSTDPNTIKWVRNCQSGGDSSNDLHHSHHTRIQALEKTPAFLPPAS